MACRVAGGLVASVLLGVLFAVTGGTDTIDQVAMAAVMVLSPLTLPLWLVAITVGVHLQTRRRPARPGNRR